MEESKYKISVIIPCYNVEPERIERNIEYIKRQTIGFNNLEIIMIDDCSTNNTMDIIKAYKEQYDNIKIGYTEFNGGPGIARNEGIKIASGEYINFIDHDDYYCNEKGLEELYTLAKEKNADIACGTIYIGNEEAPRTHFEHIEPIRNYRECLDLFKLLPALSAKLYRTDFVKTNRLKFNQSKAGEDTLFSYRAYIASVSTVVSNIVTTRYDKRKDDSITTKRNFEIGKNFIETSLSALKLFIINNISLSYFFYFPLDYIIKEYLLPIEITIEQAKEIYPCYKELSKLINYSSAYDVLWKQIREGDISDFVKFLKIKENTYERDNIMSKINVADIKAEGGGEIHNIDLYLWRNRNPQRA